MSRTLQDISEHCERCMLRDRARIRRRLRSVRARARKGLAIDRSMRELSEIVDASLALRARREGLHARLVYPAELPISERAAEIREAIEHHRVVVVAGETGSGKSTQLPKICLEAGRGIVGAIAHTQPRRIAARSIAHRLSEELGLGMGRGVGCKVRFHDTTSDEDLVRVLTDGMLLAQTQGDRELLEYDTIIIDEAHERSLNIDFLLGYLRRLLERRDDLRVIVTSATIDTARFSEHFGGAPVIEVGGRTWPVEIRYRPPAEDDDEREAMVRAIVEACDEASAQGDGDILVFLPGEREIRETSRALRRHHPPNTEILALYARLSVEEQQRVFRAHSGRRIVLATNVAETSLTVPGVRFVVDTGLARIKRYSARSKVQRLEIEAISRASADQRAGRCGRVGPGVCFRLYEQEDYERREAFTQPEILRSNLAGVILQMKALGLGRVERFPFVEAPDPRLVREGYRTLHELGAIDEEGELTEVGRRLARLPIDPRLGRMILASGDEDCVSEVLVIAAALSIQDPRDRPHDRREEADAAHEAFRDETSDFLSLLRLWDAWRDRRRHLSHRRLAQWCRAHFLSLVRMREWEDVHRQLRELASELGLHGQKEAGEADGVHRALLAGLVTQVGRLDEGFEYQGPHGVRFHLFPGSTLFAEKPRWVMCGELVRTSRLYGRMCAPVRPRWIERAASHLVTRTHGPPRWDGRRARVVCDERVSLFGLEIVPRREVHFGPINPALAREVFIHHALVEGELRTRAPFMRHNRRLVEQIRRLEERLRRRDLLADRSDRFAFFDRIVPEGVYTAGEFERWRRQAERENPRLLFLSEDDVLAQTPGADELRRFPEQVRVNGAVLPLAYRFEPSAHDDGVTVTIPLEAFESLSREVGDWTVPGLLRERVLQLLRSLPKQTRRRIAPLGALADAFCEQHHASDRSLDEALAAFVRERTGEPVRAQDMSAARVDEHLLLNYRIVDQDGQEIASGRDLRELRRLVMCRIPDDGGRIREPAFERDGIETWDIDELPETIRVERDGAVVEAYPALACEGGTVCLRLFDDSHEAHRRHRAGVLALLMHHASDDLARLTKGLPELDTIGVLYAPLGPGNEVIDDAKRLLVEYAALQDRDLPRTQEAFDASLALIWERFSEARAAVLPLLRDTLQMRQAVALEIQRGRPAVWDVPLADMRAQLDGLCPAGFVRLHPWERLRHLPRYLRAMRRRLERLASGGFSADQRAMVELSRVLRAYGEARASADGSRAVRWALDEIRWQVEELRVALFAQELGTPRPVSVTRLLRQIERQTGVRCGDV